MGDNLFNLYKILVIIPTLFLVSCASPIYIPNEIADIPTKDLAKLVKGSERTYPIYSVDGVRLPFSPSLSPSPVLVLAHPDVYITAGEHEVIYFFRRNVTFNDTTWTETEGVRCPGCSITVKTYKGDREGSLLDSGQCKLIFEANQKYNATRIKNILKAAGCSTYK
jgi:hypothetical protein